MSSIATDLSNGVKQLARHPRLSAMIIALIALAIAGNAAVFRIYDGLFLRPLPFDQPEQLINLDETAPAWNLDYTGLNFTDFAKWRRESETFTGMAIYTVFGANAADSGEASRVNVIRASHDLPEVLGIEPVVGRFFSAEEDIPNGPTVALISRSFWETRFDARPDIAGSTIKVGGVSFEIIGVYPENIKAVADGDIWSPLGESEGSQTGFYLSGIGRLKPGITLEQAGADLTRVHKSIIESRPVNEITSPILQSVTQRYIGQFREGALGLQMATAILLLIACANVAALMLARSLDRTGEFGIRMAIGSDRTRLLRQLLVESLLIGGFGGVLGAVLGHGVSEAIVAEITPRFPAFVDFDVDWRFMTFIVLATICSTVAFAVLPALSAAGTSPGSVLNGSGRRVSAGRARLRSMNTLVIAEISLTLALLISCGIFVQDVARVMNSDPGFDAQDLLTYSFAMPPAEFTTPEERDAFIMDHLDRIRSLPGVVNAAAASSLPLNGHWGWTFRVEGADPPGNGDTDPVVLMRVVSDDYFSTMGIRFVKGRPFEDNEGSISPDSVIINEAFAKSFFPGTEDPTGRRIQPLFDDQLPWMTVVGVARDVHHYGLDQAPRPGVYRPLSNYTRFAALVAVRTTVAPLSIVPAVREVLREQNGEISIYDIDTMQSRFDSALWAKNASSWLIVAYSGVALLLALAGIYGVISISVRSRQNEYCIRMALGANNSSIVKRALRHGLAVALAGISAGFVLMFFASRVISNLVVTTSATDPLIYAGASVLMLVAALSACAAPALRLRKLQPGDALRAD